MRLLMSAAALLLAGTARADEPKKEEEEAKGKIATLQAETLDKAVKTHYTQNLEWPKKLADVAPLLANGKKDLLDPWGKEYKFELRQVNMKGDVIEWPFIWTERVVGKETKVYGHKPPEEKKEEKKP